MSIEDNRLIAEFMGTVIEKETDLTLHPQGYGNWAIKYWTPRGIEIKELYTSKEGCEEWICNYGSKYHTSWDWLMPVVEKIENIIVDGSIAFSVDMGKDFCVIRYNDFIQRYIAVASVSKNKIQSVYEAVIEFIQFYNTQQKTINTTL